MRRLAPVAALLLGACSALGLADGLDQESCRACEELNAIEPQADECMRWQCDRVTSLCVVDVRDDDDDDSPNPMCVPEGEGDCDDGDETIGRGFMEVCDLVDTDCDGSVDEGALTLTRTDLNAATDADALSSALGDGAVAVVYRDDTSLVGAILPFEGSATSTPLAVQLDAPSPLDTGVARTGSDWAVALRPATGACARFVLATWSGSGGATRMPAGHELVGLPKVGGGDCGSGDTSPVGHPTLASANPLQVVAAFLADSDARACGGDAADVALAVAQRASSSGLFGDDGYGVSEVVGQSVDGRPALVGIADYGYLLAFARADGTIGVHRVQVDGVTRAFTVTPDVYVESCPAGACGDVSMRVAALADGTSEVALTYRDGSCESASATLRRLAVDPVSDTVTASADGGRVAVGPITALRVPAAARRTSPDEWVLTWLAEGAANTISMQRFTATGALVGEPRELLAAGTRFRRPIAAAGGAGREGLRVFAYDTGANVFARSAATCEEMMTP